MKKILLLLMGALLYKFALSFSIHHQLLWTFGTLLMVVFLYNQIKETRIILHLRKKVRIILCIISSIPTNPGVWALLLICSIPFAFVHNGDNKYMFDWIENAKSTFMLILKGFGPLIWFVSLLAFCITLGAYDEYATEKELQEIDRWYQEKISKIKSH